MAIKSMSYAEYLRQEKARKQRVKERIARHDAWLRQKESEHKYREVCIDTHKYDADAPKELKHLSLDSHQPQGYVRSAKGNWVVNR